MTYQGSEVTAKFYVRRVQKMLNEFGETPDSLVELSNDELYDKMLTFAKKEQKNKRAPSYIITEFKSIYSFLKHQNVDFRRIPNPKGSTTTPTVQDEVIPTGDELGKILDIAPIREKVSISFMAFSGLRPATISDTRGKKGLLMKHIIGWKITDKEIYMDSPTMIRVPPELSKTSRPYITFLCEEGVKHLMRYLNIRIREGEKITGSSPIIRNSYQGHITFIGSQAVTTKIKRIFLKSGIDKRPYVLRRYFATKLLDGEIDNVIPHTYCQFLMGHQGDMLSRYTANKGLSDKQIESLKESYINCQEYLQTNTSQKEIKNTKLEIEKIKIQNRELETKSQITQEALFEQINILKKQIENQKVMIDFLMKEKKKTSSMLSEYIEKNIETDDHGPIIIRK